MIKIIVDSQYYRDQFDDWLAGGKVEYKRRTYYWSGYNSNYGFGWEIEPITEDNWDNISESEFNKIITLIEKCIYEHKVEYVF
ncbi:MAG: hypothetical protein FJW63_06960 [Actinobacteria bacterium]|nr:hypothetical protein [Actinomycetota bacterium]